MSETIPTFAATMKRVFGTEQKPTEFMTEYKTLDANDKAYFHRILNAEGYACLLPA